jgi:myo-inositol-1(or 4)-monophosphatase
MAEFGQELEAAKKAAHIGRKILLDFFGRLKEVEDKGAGAGLVSEADKGCEAALRQELGAVFPHYSFLGEEEGIDRTSDEGMWIVDPLDGTTNYVKGFPIFCISIALQVEGEVVVGVIDAPVLNQSFTALKGHGAYLNGNPITVSQETQLSEAFLGTGFPYLREFEFERQLRLFGHFYSRTRGVRRAGAAAYDLALVAQGVFDGFWERDLKPWDMAAGSLLVKEAGGVVSGYHQKGFDPFEDSIVAANPFLHAELVQEIDKFY